MLRGPARSWLALLDDRAGLVPAPGPPEQGGTGRTRPAWTAKPQALVAGIGVHAESARQRASHRDAMCGALSVATSGRPGGYGAYAGTGEYQASEA